MTLVRAAAIAKTARAVAAETKPASALSARFVATVDAEGAPVQRFTQTTWESPEAAVRAFLESAPASGTKGPRFELQLNGGLTATRTGVRALTIHVPEGRFAPGFLQSLQGLAKKSEVTLTLPVSRVQAGGEGLSHLSFSPSGTATLSPAGTWTRGALGHAEFVAERTGLDFGLDPKKTGLAKRVQVVASNPAVPARLLIPGSLDTVKALSSDLLKFDHGVWPGMPGCIELTFPEGALRRTGASWRIAPSGSLERANTLARELATRLGEQVDVDPGPRVTRSLRSLGAFTEYMPDDVLIMSTLPKVERKLRGALETAVRTRSQGGKEAALAERQAVKALEKHIGFYDGAFRQLMLLGTMKEPTSAQAAVDAKAYFVQVREQLERQWGLRR